MGVWVAGYGAGEPVGQVGAPPFAEAFPDYETDVGVEYRAEEGGLDLFTAVRRGGRGGGLWLWDGARSGGDGGTVVKEERDERNRHGRVDGLKLTMAAV